MKNAWKRFWENRFIAAEKRFESLVREWLEMMENGEYSVKRSRKIMRKERIQLIIEQISMFLGNL